MIDAPLILGWVLAAPAAALLAAQVMRRREGGLGRRQWLRALLVFGLVAGTVTHVSLVWRWGLRPNPYEPLAYNAFWSALTLVDPALALCVVLAPRVGIVGTVALLIADVSVNAVSNHHAGVGIDFALGCQLGFGLFALAAAPWCWPGRAPAPVAT